MEEIKEIKKPHTEEYFFTTQMNLCTNIKCKANMGGTSCAYQIMAIDENGKCSWFEEEK